MISVGQGEEKNARGWEIGQVMYIQDKFLFLCVFFNFFALRKIWYLLSNVAIFLQVFLLYIRHQIYLKIIIIEQIPRRVSRFRIISLKKFPSQIIDYDKFPNDRGSWWKVRQSGGKNYQILFLSNYFYNKTSNIHLSFFHGAPFSSSLQAMSTSKIFLEQTTTAIFSITIDATFPHRKKTCHSRVISGG